MNPFIIALTGPAGCGKDTTAALLREALQARGRKVDTMAYADPIRWMLAAMGVPPQYMTDRQLKEDPIEAFNGMSYRQMAQTLGTEWGRACNGVNFWRRLLQSRLERLREVGKCPDMLIITDARFANEVDWIRGRGVVVRIDRPNLQAVRDHVSERVDLLPPADLILHNDSDLVGLRARVAGLSNLILAEKAIAA